MERAERVATEVLAPAAADTDRTGAFPRRQLNALRDAGLFGLQADPAHGGEGEGLLTACLMIEALAKACSSTAPIYKMHLESIEMICRAPTAEQATDVMPKMVSSALTFDGFIADSRILNPDNPRVDLMPVVLGTYAATNRGIAGGCFDLLHAHLATGVLADGRFMGDVETIQAGMATCKVELERSRALLYAPAPRSTPATKTARSRSSKRRWPAIRSACSSPAGQDPGRQLGVRQATALRALFPRRPSRHGDGRRA